MKVLLHSKNNKQRTGNSYLHCLILSNVSFSVFDWKGDLPNNKAKLMTPIAQKSTS